MDSTPTRPTQPRHQLLRNTLGWLGRFWDRGAGHKAVLLTAIPLLTICACCSGGTIFAVTFSATPLGQQLALQTQATETAQAINARQAAATRTAYALAQPTPTAPAPPTHAPVPTAPATPAPVPTVSTPPITWPANATTPASSGTVWYFAEGSTGGSNREYLTLANPSAVPAHVHVRYLLLSGAPVERDYVVAPASRATKTVNTEVGAGQDVAMVVTSNVGIVAERPMYFTYQLHGATALSTEALFGAIETTSRHDTYLTILNPHDSAMTVRVDYFPAAPGATITRTHAVGPTARGTVNVRTDVPDGVYSAVVHLSLPGLVERPLYLQDASTGYTGAADVVGVPVPQTQWLFAEGLTSGKIMRERYVLANLCPSPECAGVRAANATLTYFTGPGKAPQIVQLVITPGRQQVVDAASTLGAEHVENSVSVTADQPILAERFMSFTYGSRQGATDVVGTAHAGKRFYFAEGNASSTFDAYLTLENPDPVQTATVHVAFLPERADDNVQVRTVTVAPTSRFTLKANTVVAGAFALAVDADRPIVAERPVYFTFGAAHGGSDVIGYQSVTLPMPKPRPAPTPTAAPRPTAAPQPTATPTDVPAPQPQPTPTCIPDAVNCNPWGYNFSPGNRIYSPPADFCSYFSCIGNFWNGRGYVMECNDGMYSKSGGIQGSCSYHGGNWRTLYSH